MFWIAAYAAMTELIIPTFEPGSTSSSFRPPSRNPGDCTFWIAAYATMTELVIPDPAFSIRFAAANCWTLPSPASGGRIEDGGAEPESRNALVDARNESVGSKVE